jgi:hypothetical protein
MKRERFSLRRSMAVERARKAYEINYGLRLSPRVFESLAAAELEDLAERLVAQSEPGIERIAVLGYN